MIRLAWPAVGLLAAAIGAASAATAETATPPDPAAVTRWCAAEQQGAHELAVDLRKREEAVQAAETAAQGRAAELDAAAKRLDARMAELTTLRKELDARLAEADAADEAHLVELVAMIEANKPPAIAPMFQKLDPALAVKVLDRMKRAKAGKLLMALPPEQAAALAARMAAPLTLPTPKP